MENSVLSFLEKEKPDILEETVYSSDDLDLLISPKEEAVIYLYARVSSVKEQQVDAVKYQTSNLERWLEQQCSLHSNWHKGKTFVDIKSGRNFNRAEYKKMMREVKRGGVTYIVFWETSRFGRTFGGVLRECLKLKDTYGVDLYFIDKKIDTRSPDGLSRLADEARKADESSLQTKARVDRGIREKKEVLEALGDGYLFTNRALGLIRKPGIKQRLFRVDSEVETLNIMANYYLECKSLSKTAAHLTELKRETVNGSIYWDASTILRCLHNPIYVCIEEQNKTKINYGENYYNGSRTKIDKSQHNYKYMPHRIERIWSDEFFLLIQETLRANRRLWSCESLGKDDKVNYYKDLVWCDCGGRCNIHSAKIAYGKNWYECHNQKHKGSKRYIELAGLDKNLICERTPIQDWKLDMMFEEIIKELKFTKEKFISNISEIIKTVYVCEDMVSDELEELDLSIKAIKKQLSSARQLMYKELITETEYKEDSKLLHDDLAVKEAQREKLIQRKKENESKVHLNISTLQKQLSEKVDYILEKDKNKFLFEFVYMIVHTGNNEYTWVLNLFEELRDTYIPDDCQLVFTQRIQNRIDEVVVDKRNLIADFKIGEFEARTFKRKHELGSLKQYETLKVKVYY